MDSHRSPDRLSRPKRSRASRHDGPYGRIPRPRHLFPEVAAVFIETQRGGWRVIREVQRAIGVIPAWTVGAAAGVASIMLAALLFFITDPRVHASANVPETPAVDPTPAAPLITSTIPVNLGAPVQGSPFIRYQIQRTRLPMFWNPDLLRVTSSREAPQANANLSALYSLSDRWRRTYPNRAELHSQPVVPYAGVQPFAAAGPAAFSADAIPYIDAPPLSSDLGVTIEKRFPENLNALQPMTYQIFVRNPTSRTIESLSVREQISAIRRVTQVFPDAAVEGDELVWTLGSLLSGESRLLNVTLVPDGSTDIQTQTTVTPLSRIGAAAKVNAPAVIEEILPTTATEPAPPPAPPVKVPEPPRAPDLRLSFDPVRTLKQGDTLSIVFTVTNVGTAPAEDVELYVRLSGEFEHRFGEFVKHRIRSLEPGQKHTALLQATVKNSGTGVLATSLTMQGAEEEAHRMDISIQPGPQELSQTPESLRSETSWKPHPASPQMAATLE